MSLIEQFADENPVIDVENQAAIRFPSSARPGRRSEFAVDQRTSGSVKPASLSSSIQVSGGWCLSHSIVGCIGFLTGSFANRLCRETSLATSFASRRWSSSTERNCHRRRGASSTARTWSDSR